jgi:diaminohydroxyphosphoribosylaminopyrimidine deaminase/5-amino-6-(5-phosphoribosylamino)uracil reductase
MQRALRLAARGLGRVEPNPMVGCVIVRNDRVVGEGYHRRFGGAHAEVVALARAGPKARGATVYVTLEPCCHYGKTPPCTEALQAAKVARVFAAMRDTNPLVSGKGLRALKKAGIEVVERLLHTEARELNAAYLKWETQGQPYVIAKWAQSIDGKIATRSGDSRWISSERARKWTHRIRARVDGIIVGSETVLRDEPEMTCRAGPLKRLARRVILDTRLRTPVNSKLVRTAREIPTLVFTSRQATTTARARRLGLAGVVIKPAALRGEHISLKHILKKLAEQGMSNVLIEGGGQVLGSAFDQGLVDEAIVFIAPRLIGGSRAPSALSGKGVSLIAQAQRLKNLKIRRIGPDMLYHFRLPP